MSRALHERGSEVSAPRTQRLRALQIVGLGVAFLAAAAVTGVLVGSAISLFAQWPAATVPGCPDGSSLYTRTEVRGTVAFPVQHCFKDGDAKDMKPQP
jgi:hypothetical protein